MGARCKMKKIMPPKNVPRMALFDFKLQSCLNLKINKSIKIPSTNRGFLCNVAVAENLLTVEPLVSFSHSSRLQSWYIGVNAVLGYQDVFIPEAAARDGSDPNIPVCRMLLFSECLCDGDAL